MKLTEDTKILEGIGSDEFPIDIFIKDIDEPVRRQILENQKIVERYDNLMKANSEVVQQNISLTQLQQENKQLKEDKQTLHDQNLKQVGEIVNLEQNLEKALPLIKRHYPRYEESKLKEILSTNKDAQEVGKN